MHSPPPVSYPFDRSATPWQVLWLVLFGAGVVAIALAKRQPDIQTLLILATAWGISAGVVAIAWAQAPSGTLVWDGSRWHCTAWNKLDVNNVHIAMDYQSHLLVALSPTEVGLRRWVWLSRKADPMKWHALRCALVAGAQSPVIYQ